MKPFDTLMGAGLPGMDLPKPSGLKSYEILPPGFNADVGVSSGLSGRKPYEMIPMARNPMPWGGESTARSGVSHERGPQESQPSPVDTKSRSPCTCATVSGHCADRLNSFQQDMGVRFYGASPLMQKAARGRIWPAVLSGIAIEPFIQPSDISLGNPFSNFGLLPPPSCAPFTQQCEDLAAALNLLEDWYHQAHGRRLRAHARVSECNDPVRLANLGCESIQRAIDRNRAEAGPLLAAVDIRDPGSLQRSNDNSAEFGRLTMALMHCQNEQRNHVMGLTDARRAECNERRREDEEALASEDVAERLWFDLAAFVRFRLRQMQRDFPGCGRCDPWLPIP